MAVTIPFSDTVSSADSSSVLHDDAILYCPDSVFRSPDPSSLPLHKSLFKGHVLPVRHNVNIPLPSSGDYGLVFGLAIFMAILLCVALKIRRINLKDVLPATMSMRHLNILMRGSNIKDDVSLVPLSLIYYVTLAMVAFVAIPHLDLQLTSNLWLNLAITTSSSLAFSLLRFGLMKGLGAICSENGTIKLYANNSSLFQLISAVLILPLMVLAQYTSPGLTFLWIAAAIVVLTFVLRMIRGLGIILTESGESKIYLFYYLCIIEIVPLLVLAKIANIL